MNKIEKLTVKQKEVIERLNHEVYTVKYIEDFIYREGVNTFNNAPVACIMSGCYGFIEAVNQIIKIEGK
jgi:hypothetical protein